MMAQAAARAVLPFTADKAAAEATVAAADDAAAAEGAEGDGADAGRSTRASVRYGFAAGGARRNSQYSAGISLAASVFVPSVMD